MNDGGYNPDSYLSWAYGQKLIQLKPGCKDKKVVKRIPGIGMTARCVALTFEKAKDLDEQLKWIVVHDEQLPF